MMREHRNAMRAEVASTGQESASTRMGTISGYDATNYLAKVLLQPDGTETGWLPIGAIGVGNGWGVQVGPSIGDVVEVEFQDGGVDAGLIVQRFFNDQARPMAVPSGEVWAVHKNGQFIKFLGDGTIASSGPWNHAGTLHVTGNITGDADVVATGDVKDQGGAKSMAGMRTVFNAHVHNDPQGGSTSTPTTGM